MPVHPVPGGWQWGTSGKVYKSKAAAEAQARAIYASGWREDRARLAGHRALSASKRAEARYVLDLVRILGAVHRGVLKVVHREHPALARQDADGPRIGLSDALLRRMFTYVKPQAQTAFDFMADEVDKQSARGTELVGIRPRTVPGLASTIDRARKKNVDLIVSASSDFLDQVRGVLEDTEGERPESIAKALQARVDVSKSRAILIARDQTTKLNAALNQDRQRAAGVESYRWSTSHDERVRPSHADLDGQVFSWDDPPIVDEEEANPGEPIQCRCIALPIIAELEAPEEAATGQEPEEEDLGQAAE